MQLSRRGYSTTVKNVEYLDRIYDLLEGRFSIQTIGIREYVVWKDQNIPKEVKELEKYLMKPWHSYVNYNWCNKNRKMISETQFNQKLAVYNKTKKKEKEKIREEDRGIYGIYYKRQLVYIGKTNVSFKTRFQQHQLALKNRNRDQFLYKFLEGKEVEFKPIINVKDLRVDGKVSNRDIEAMELALITLYKPICNVQGVKIDYVFS